MQRKTITLPRDLYEVISNLSPPDRLKVYDNLFKNLFEEKPPDKDLNEIQKLVFVVFAPRIRKMQVQFENGKNRKIFSRTSEKSQIKPKTSEESVLYNYNILSNNTSFNLNKQTNINSAENAVVEQGEAEKRQFFYNTIKTKIISTFDIEHQAEAQTLMKVLDRVVEEKSDFKISGRLVTVSAWLERFLDIFRRDQQDICDIVNDACLGYNQDGSLKPLTNKYRYWIAKTYNILSEF